MTASSFPATHPSEADQPRRRVCVQGLGFVGAANAIAIASATDGAGRAVFQVVGLDLPNEAGRARADAINNGRFPFSTTDESLVSAAAETRRLGSLSAVTDPAVLSEAEVIVVDVGLDLDEKGARIITGR